MAKSKTPLEIRAEHARAILELDKARAEKVAEIFARPEMATALEELREIYDPAPASIGGTAGSNVNVLIKSAITVIENTPIHAQAHIDGLTAALAPAEPVPVIEGSAPQDPAPQPPQTPEA